jgi:hypothetical protein
MTNGRWNQQLFQVLPPKTIFFQKYRKGFVSEITTFVGRESYPSALDYDTTYINSQKE